MAADDPDSTPVEDLVAEFLLEREEGRNPSIDDWLARYPKHAEVLAQLLSDDTASPATLRRPAARATVGQSRAAAPAASPDAMRLGPYDVLSHVSTAGGGTVYRARHKEAGHLVALKVLDSRGAVDPRDIERFHREAAMLRALNLVHVVPVLDAGEDGGRSWIAMKWLEGDTFSKLREAAADKSHRLYDIRERARLVGRVARTFAAIHAYGILHRDVKPTNIMVDTTGEPMIIDFGIAQAPDLPELTTTIDQVMGTPRFLAPELLSGGNRQVSPKTDVYGLGLCLYELCTGAEAFKQEVRADLFTAIRTTGPTHPRKANPALSHDFAAVILRSIEIDPARRYPDMATFADDLDRIARGEAPEPTTLRGAHPLLRAIRRHKKRLIAAACLAALVIPAGWMLTSRGLDEIKVRKQEAILRPFAWFSPEAFAGGIGVPDRSIAGELASNEAATPDQRLIAAWIPFLSGDFPGAFRNLELAPAAGGFASRLLRKQLEDLKEYQDPGFTPVTLEKINPETGEPFEILLPSHGVQHSLKRDLARFEEHVKAVSADLAPRLPVDHLVLATLRWFNVPSDPGFDATATRAAIQDSLGFAITDDHARIPATHLRGVMRFLSGELPGARSDFEAVLKAQPDAVGTRVLLGIVLNRLRDAQHAVGHLELAVRDMPPGHAARGKVLGQLALARSAAGQLDGALAACREWWTAGDKANQWQDAVIPRVLAARLLRDHGDLQASRNLLVEAVHENERNRAAERKLAERGLSEEKKDKSPLPLWEPALRELSSVAESVGDTVLAEEVRDRLAMGGLLPTPKGAEAYLDLNLTGLRAPDNLRALTPIVPGPKNE